MDIQKLYAVKSNDKTFDGKFFYGVKTTGIFCLPSCKSKLPLEKNIVFFDSYEQAIYAGFRPCKRCRPDLYITYSPNEQLLKEIKNYFDKNFCDNYCLEGLSDRFNMSSFHLVRIFKRRFGTTPREYVQSSRIEKAKELLTSSALKAVDIAFMCGFSSYTAFFTNFKKLTGVTPDKYRKGR